MSRNKKLFRLQPDHVFADGVTLKNVRDAIIASGVTGMFRIGWEMAKRYDLQEALCMKCANALHVSQGTYLTRNGQAMRFCAKCVSMLPRNH